MMIMINFFEELKMGVKGSRYEVGYKLEVAKMVVRPRDGYNAS